MGELIDITGLLKQNRLKENIAKINDRFSNAEVPPPEDFGWSVVEVYEGQPVQYFNPKYRARIGYVDGNPDYVFLDYNHTCCAYSMNLSELALGLEFGTLPEHDFVVS